MDSVQKVCMRMHPVLAIAIAGATASRENLAAAFIERRRSSASLGGVTFAGAPVINLVLSPNPATLVIGQSVQLLVNLPDTLRNQLLWRSLTPTIAVVNQDGIVTAVSPGQATILARLAFDTNRVAPATIIVPGVIAVPGVVVVP